jgi:type III pantothenate kinase
LSKKIFPARSRSSGKLLLAVDAGNTHITIGVYGGKKLLRTWRLHTNRHATADELGLLFLGLLRHTIREKDQIKGVVIASVVPALDEPLRHAAIHYLRIAPVIVGSGARLSVKNLYQHPEEVGADRLADAVAAFHIFKTATIVVDFGTATTFNCVTAQGEYLGGAICPGLELASEWLATHAAKIPRVAFPEAPRRALGRTTKESLQSGMFWGYIGLVEGLLQRLIKEMKTNPKVIATGGLSTVIGPHIPGVTRILPNLTLDGLRLIWERNQ